jgi:uncharacterized protein YjbI with pentapeptide repeats
MLCRPVRVASWPVTGKARDLSGCEARCGECSLQIRSVKLVVAGRGDGFRQEYHLVRAELSHENMPDLSLIGANLSGADLSGANLSQGNLTGAVLVRAKFNNAVLSGADLTGADLKRAVLRQAILTGAVLTNANLFAASLHRAKLAGVNPTHAYWPTGEPIPKGWRWIPGSRNHLER